MTSVIFRLVLDENESIARQVPQLHDALKRSFGAQNKLPNRTIKIVKYGRQKSTTSDNKSSSVPSSSVSNTCMLVDSSENKHSIVLINSKARTVLTCYGDAQGDAYDLLHASGMKMQETHVLQGTAYSHGDMSVILYEIRGYRINQSAADASTIGMCVEVVLNNVKHYYYQPKHHAQYVARFGAPAARGPGSKSSQAAGGGIATALAQLSNNHQNIVQQQDDQIDLIVKWALRQLQGEENAVSGDVVTPKYEDFISPVQCLQYSTLHQAIDYLMVLGK